VLPERRHKVFLGFDANEMRACAVAEASLYRHTSRAEVQAERICRLSLWQQYSRPTTRMPNGQLFDEISGAPMSTDHAIARFWVPRLCGYRGHALFCDGDVMFREDVRQLFALADDRFAVQVVQHPPLLEEGDKKAGHVQQAYPKKNWSSVCLWNCGHPANAALTQEVLNTWPGRELHAFDWLSSDLIGELPARWNYLAGVSAHQDDPALVHFTLGTPDTAGRERSQFSDEWCETARQAGYRAVQAVK
jgi:lipopolysaccharide biosynthesis glycosyltransferase